MSLSIYHKPPVSKEKKVPCRFRVLKYPFSEQDVAVPNLPYIDDALITIAEMVSIFRNSSSVNKQAFRAVFDALAGHPHMNDKSRDFVQEIMQGWGES